MADSVYEGMFILDSGRFSRDPDGVSGQIPRMIEDAGGRMLVSRLWEERRLAYAIKGHRKGAYWLTYFRLPGGKLAELHRKCQLADSILRTLILKVDPRIVDTLVEHAKGGPVEKTSEKKVEPSAAQAGDADKKAATAEAETGTAEAAAARSAPSDSTGK